MSVRIVGSARVNRHNRSTKSVAVLNLMDRLQPRRHRISPQCWLRLVCVSPDGQVSLVGVLRGFRAAVQAQRQARGRVTPVALAVLGPGRPAPAEVRCHYWLLESKEKKRDDSERRACHVAAAI